VTSRSVDRTIGRPGAAGARPLAVITVAYNSAAALPGLLDSLLANRVDFGPFEVVVVDNASRDGSVAIARAHPVGARVLATGRNGGYSAGINAGARLAPPDADLLVLNPDTRLAPDALRVLCAALNDPAVGVALPQLRDQDGAVALSLRREPSLVTAWADALVGAALAARLGLGEIVAEPRLYAEGGPADRATGGALLIAARARRAVGEWDESLFRYSAEGEYLRRGRTAGRDVVYVPGAHVYHKGGDSLANPRLAALLAVNRLRDFGRCHGRVATQLFRLAMIVGAAMRLGRGPVPRATLHAALRPSRASQPPRGPAPAERQPSSEASVAGPAADPRG
jgi:GT2 family glycosyltransferase